MADLELLGGLPCKQIWDGVVARVLEGDRIGLAIVELDAGAVVPEHRHENEQLGFVITGPVTFTLGGETKELGPGGTWRILSGTPHEVVAGPGGAVVADIFAPPRADWAGLPAAPVGELRWPR
jgi:quercetin dioxygenase-like cupin family protein